jgi:hypothetical protein
VQRLLELFVPAVPYAKLRLCVLLSFVSGDPVLPLEEATGVRQSIHVLVHSSEAMPVVLHVLNAAKNASRLPCEVGCANIPRSPPSLPLNPCFCSRRGDDEQDGGGMSALCHRFLQEI